MIFAAFLRFFLSARHKSNLGAQQRLIGQRCSAWLEKASHSHPKNIPSRLTIAFFGRFISILIPKTSCPKRTSQFFPGFGASSTAIRPGESHMWGDFWGTDVRPCFFLKGEIGMMETEGCTKYSPSAG